ncbi:hypothetical protein K438DRAFT_399956 [Mycena galopus ATCC 62051]|nr:hypothetical protein K438DRAFT_399956 [Mycena galopus ATCC 62051]
MDVFEIEEDIFMFESAEERQLREMRTQQNELVPIARLPPEILADIFIRCVPTSIRRLYGDLGWLNLTRVSSQWRNVALACPDFWSTLIFSRPKWTPVMLARSKMASLVVRVNLLVDHANSPEPILLENASRLGTLDIYSSPTLLATFLANLEHAGPAPRLQHIRVVNADVLDPGGLWLPGNLFHRTEVIQSRKVGTQPGVRLHLECCAFPWDSRWYFNLTHLHLENIAPAQRPTMEMFLAVLNSSPNLQTLAAIHCCPFTGGPSIVELLHLSLLTITDDPSSVCLLLSCLIIPPSAIINTSSAIYTHYPPDLIKTLTKTIYQDLIPIFSEDLPPDTYDTVRIDYRSGFTYSLHHSARSEWSRNLRLDAASWGHDHALRVTESVRDYLDFSNITTVHLDGMPPMTMSLPWTPEHDQAFYSDLSLWDTMGRNLRNVHTLHLHQSFPSSWLEFMLTQAMLFIGVSHHRSCFNVPTSQRGLTFRDPDGALTLGWPALRRLVLHDIDLSELLDRFRPSCGDVLRALLWARRQGKAPIWQLELERCAEVSKYLQHFRLFADVVHNEKGQNKKHTTAEQDESLTSYSIDVFARLVLGALYSYCV